MAVSSDFIMVAALPVAVANENGAAQSFLLICRVKEIVPV